MVKNNRKFETIDDNNFPDTNASSVEDNMMSTPVINSESNITPLYESQKIPNLLTPRTPPVSPNIEKNRVNDFDRMVRHEDFARILSLSAKVKSARMSIISKNIQNGELPPVPDVDVDGVARMIRAKCCTKSGGSGGKKNGSDLSVPAVFSRGLYPHTDSLIDESIRTLQMDFEQCKVVAKKISPEDNGPRRKKIKLDIDKSSKSEPIAIKYSKWQTDILTDWMIKNKSHPFPDAEATNKLCQETNLSYSQIVNWTTNVRKRNLKATVQGNKKPHHFLDFLFLAEDRDKKALKNKDNHPKEAPPIKIPRKKSTANKSQKGRPDRQEENSPSDTSKLDPPTHPQFQFRSYPYASGVHQAAAPPSVRAYHYPYNTPAGPVPFYVSSSHGVAHQFPQSHYLQLPLMKDRTARPNFPHHQPVHPYNAAVPAHGNGGYGAHGTVPTINGPAVPAVPFAPRPEIQYPGHHPPDAFHGHGQPQNVPHISTSVSTDVSTEGRVVPLHDDIDEAIGNLLSSDSGFWNDDDVLAGEDGSVCPPLLEEWLLNSYTDESLFGRDFPEMTVADGISDGTPMMGRDEAPMTEREGAPMTERDGAPMMVRDDTRRNGPMHTLPEPPTAAAHPPASLPWGRSGSTISVDDSLLRAIGDLTDPMDMDEIVAEVYGSDTISI